MIVLENGARYCSSGPTCSSIRIPVPVRTTNRWLMVELGVAQVAVRYDARLSGGAVALGSEGRRFSSRLVRITNA